MERGVRVLAFVVMTMATLSLFAETEVLATETVDGITWTYCLIDGNTHAQVGLNDADYDYANKRAVPESTSGEITIPSTLGGRPVTEIADGAFMSRCFPSRNETLTNVTIPYGVVRIGEKAFGGCVALTNMVIPSSVTSIEPRAFGGCTGLVSVVIPSSVTYIGSGYDYAAFGGCTGLRDVTVPGWDCGIDFSTVTNVVIADGTTEISTEAFRNCASIMGVTIPSSVTTIGWHVFSGCDSLSSVKFEGAPPQGLPLAGIKQDAAIRYNVAYETAWLPVIAECGFTNAVPYTQQKPEGGPYTEVVDGIEWTYMINDGEASIGDGIEAAVTNTVAGAVEIPSVLGGWPVAKISINAFYNRKNVASVTIPSSVTSIGERAFVNCDGLTSVIIPSSVTSIGSSAFSGCFGLTDVTLQDGLLEIDSLAFSHCRKLISIKIPASVTRIGGAVFAYCSGLTSIDVADGNAHYKSENNLLLSKDGSYLEEGVNGDVVIPSCVTSIGPDAFEGRKTLTSVSIPSCVTDVSFSAFSDCVGLTAFHVDENNLNFRSENGLLLSKDGERLIAGVNRNVIIPSTVKVIGAYAFTGRSGISSITIPTSVTSIESSAFIDCDGLTSMTIPSSVLSIGNHAFGWCGRLKSVVIQSGVATIGYRAFYQCDQLTSVTIPESVVDIGCDAFHRFSHGPLSVDFEGAPPSGLVSANVKQDATIRYNVEYEAEWLPVIAECGFTNATPYTPPKKDGGPYAERVGDTEWTFVVANSEAIVNGADSSSEIVTIPSELGARAVTRIGDYALNGYTNLTSVTIPASVKEIGSETFSGCEKLADVWFEGNAIEKIGADAFSGCYWDLIMHVPADWQGRGQTIAGYTVWRGGSSDAEKFVNLTVTNVVVQYVLNSVQPEIAVPSAETGFVNIITEVKSSGAVSVPTEWRDNYPQFETKYGTDFAKALMTKSGKKDAAGNDMFVWQDFVAGTDPTKEDDVFTASVTMVGGVPVISYSPELSDAEKAKRIYTTWGKTKLTDAEWSEVAAGHEADYNFFKITVEMK